jgi:hypothetical protein
MKGLNEYISKTLEEYRHNLLSGTLAIKDLKN